MGCRFEDGVMTENLRNRVEMAAQAKKNIILRSWEFSALEL